MRQHWSLIQSMRKLEASTTWLPMDSIVRLLNGIKAKRSLDARQTYLGTVSNRLW